MHQLLQHVASGQKCVCQSLIRGYLVWFWDAKCKVILRSEKKLLLLIFFIVVVDFFIVVEAIFKLAVWESPPNKLDQHFTKHVGWRRRQTKQNKLHKCSNKNKIALPFKTKLACSLLTFVKWPVKANKKYIFCISPNISLHCLTFSFFIAWNIAGMQHAVCNIKYKLLCSLIG